MCVLYTVSDRTPYLNWQAIICPTGPRTVRFSLKRPVKNLLSSGVDFCFNMYLQLSTKMQEMPLAIDLI